MQASLIDICSEIRSRNVQAPAATAVTAAAMAPIAMDAFAGNVIRFENENYLGMFRFTCGEYVPLAFTQNK